VIIQFFLAGNFRKIFLALSLIRPVVDSGRIDVARRSLTVCLFKYWWFIVRPWERNHRRLTMLGPLRRSLGAVVLESGLRCSTCARPLHTHAQLQNSAAAAAQADIPRVPPQWAQHKKPSKPVQSSGQQQPRAKQPPRQSRAPQPAPQPTPQKSKTSGQSKFAAISQSKGKQKAAKPSMPPMHPLVKPKVYMDRSWPPGIQKESEDVNSPFYFDQSEVLELYDHPEESVFPDEIRLKRGREGAWRTWKWKDQPYSLLVEGLNIIFEASRNSERRIKLPDGSFGVRVKLTGRHHRNVGVAIGDGSDKVTHETSPRSDV
jgi:hypothetical protein